MPVRLGPICSSGAPAIRHALPRSHGHPHLKRSSGSGAQEWPGDMGLLGVGTTLKCSCPGVSAGTSEGRGWGLCWKQHPCAGGRPAGHLAAHTDGSLCVRPDLWLLAGREQSGGCAADQPASQDGGGGGWRGGGLRGGVRRPLRSPHSTFASLPPIVMCHSHAVKNTSRWWPSSAPRSPPFSPWSLLSF